MTVSILQLTWAGFDAAVDVIAAQCPRDRLGVHGVDRGGQLMAWALSERLGIEMMRRPGSEMLQLHGVAVTQPRLLWGDALVMAWLDATPGQNLMAVCKATPGTTVLMPWQDAPTSRRQFVPGFDD
jgi:hypothetical protein